MSPFCRIRHKHAIKTAGDMMPGYSISQIITDWLVIIETPMPI